MSTLAETIAKAKRVPMFASSAAVPIGIRRATSPTTIPVMMVVL
jgi:hypothetical protein